jgi:hypothetical protein
MSWFSAIHIKTTNIESIIQVLRNPLYDECYVGYSGNGWIGVYLKKVETSRGVMTREFVLRLSENLFDKYAIGLFQDESALLFWLYKGGLLLDSNEDSKTVTLFPQKRPLITLVDNAEHKDIIQFALLNDMRRATRKLSRYSEEEFIAKAYEDMNRVHSMSVEDRKRMSNKYALERKFTPSSRMKALCNALSIESYSLMFSDFSNRKDEATSLSWMHLVHVSSGS